MQCRLLSINQRNQHSIMSNAIARPQDLVTIAAMSVLGLMACVNAQSSLFWGVATSSYQVDFSPTLHNTCQDIPCPFPPCFTVSQVEGAVDADGRGQTVWDTFSHTPGKIADGSTADIADDFYDQYLNDIDLMQANGIKNFRFSIAWSRIYPTGTGQVTCNCPFHAVQISLAYQLGIVAAMMGKPSATTDL